MLFNDQKFPQEFYPRSQLNSLSPKSQKRQRSKELTKRRTKNGEIKKKKKRNRVVTLKPSQKNKNGNQATIQGFHFFSFIFFFDVGKKLGFFHFKNCFLKRAIHV